MGHLALAFHTCLMYNFGYDQYTSRTPHRGYDLMRAKTKYRPLLKSNQGAALAMTLIVLSVFTILLASMSIMFTANFKMAKKQEEDLKAYYYALSGIDVAKSTLLSPLYIDGATGGEKTMIDKIKANTPPYDSFQDTLVLDGTNVDVTVEYDDANSTVEIQSHVELDSGGMSTLTLSLNVEGSTYSEQWN
jgi:hypothetical protein